MASVKFYFDSPDRSWMRFVRSGSRAEYFLSEFTDSTLDWILLLSLSLIFLERVATRSTIHLHFMTQDLAFPLTHCCTQNRRRTTVVNLLIVVFEPTTHRKCHRRSWRPTSFALQTRRMPLLLLLIPSSVTIPGKRRRR